MEQVLWPEKANEAIGEAIFLLEKATDPFKAPEERERFAKKALEELKGVHCAAVFDGGDETKEDEDDLFEDFDNDFDEDEYEDDEDDDEELTIDDDDLYADDDEDEDEEE